MVWYTVVVQLVGMYAGLVVGDDGDDDDDLPPISSSSSLIDRMTDTPPHDMLYQEWNEAMLYFLHS